MSLSFFRVSLICLGLLAFAIQAMLYFHGFFAISADESGRTLVAYNWLHHGFDTPPIWLPLFTGVTASALQMFPDLFWTPRIVATFFAMVCFYSVPWLSWELFGKRGIVLLTAALTLAFSPRVILSAAPLSETMFASLVIAGGAFFARSLRYYNTKAVLVAACFFALSTAVRYEGWIYALAFVFAVSGAVVVTSLPGRRITHFGAAATIALAFPVAWMTLHWHFNGSPTAFVSGTANRYELLHGSGLNAILKNSLPYHFVTQSFETLNLFGLFSVIFFLISDSKIRIWCITPILSFLAMSALSLSGMGMPSHNFWRIPFSWSMLLIPFTAYSVFAVWHFIRSRFGALSWVFLFGFFLIYSYQAAIQTRSWVSRSAFTKNDLAAGQYIQRFIESGDDPLVILDSQTWSYLNLKVASQHPDIVIVDAGHDPVKPKESLLMQLEVEQGRRVLVVLENVAKKELVSGDLGFHRRADFGKWTTFTRGE